MGRIRLDKKNDGSSIGVVMILSNTQAPLAGTLKQALSLANELQSQGVSLSIVSKREWISKVVRGGRLGDWPHQAINEKIKFIGLPTLRLQPAWSFLFSFLIWAGINRKRFQIIHAHNAALGVIASLVGWLMRKKVVIKIPSEKYVEYLNGGSLSRQLRRWILTRKADRFIAVSTEMVQALREVGIPPEKNVLIRNGIELVGANHKHNRNAIKREVLGSPEVQVVLFVGRLVEEKGLGRLLTVWASMRCREEMVLLIVGEGPLRGDLESQARALGLLPSVRFLGHQGDVSKFYAIADLFVLPSKTEGTSNSLLEAMAAGISVVASNVGGNRDVIEDQQSGFLVDWENTRACVEVLSTLLSDPNLRSRMGNAAYRRACTFDMGDVAERYQHLYKAVLQE